MKTINLKVITYQSNLFEVLSYNGKNLFDGINEIFSDDMIAIFNSVKDFHHWEFNTDINTIADTIRHKTYN